MLFLSLMVFNLQSATIADSSRIADAMRAASDAAFQATMSSLPERLRVSPAATVYVDTVSFRRAATAAGVATGSLQDLPPAFGNRGRVSPPEGAVVCRTGPTCEVINSGAVISLEQVRRGADELALEIRVTFTARRGEDRSATGFQTYRVVLKQEGGRYVIKTLTLGKLS
jgi:hypothetical protein